MKQREPMFKRRYAHKHLNRQKERKRWRSPCFITVNKEGEKICTYSFNIKPHSLDITEME